MRELNVILAVETNWWPANLNLLKQQRNQDINIGQMQPLLRSKDDNIIHEQSDLWVFKLKFEALSIYLQSEYFFASL